ncbi:MAG: ADP-ribosylglycohydrolase family protein [Syntrophorhabdus sp.]
MKNNLEYAILNLESARVLGGLWGAIIGDALGVPVEFMSREEVRRNPVTGMRGYGTFNLPPGSWSDDSSLILCTVESLLDGFDTTSMGELFIRWLTEGHWTPWGNTFDVGASTMSSIGRMMREVSPEEAGGRGENDNGNGSLMRILPIGIFFSRKPVKELLNYVHRASSLTHRHPRTLIACGVYCLMVSALLKGFTPDEAYLYALEQAAIYYAKLPYAEELPHFERLFSTLISSVSETNIKSGGYVIHTLEASIWCLLNTSSFQDAVLKAVNLGEDTDTTGCVTGGLAGLYYGLEAVPKEWIYALARKDDIGNLFKRLTSKITEA